ncbi:MAG: hypothetical protein QM628_00440, partial [Propionicimonas sp.]
SRVEAWGSSRVVARGSSRVEAWGSSRVVARESSRVEARGSSRVEASPYVAVHLHSAVATVRGGVIIDIAALDMSDPEVWCQYHGVVIADGIATLYKAVEADYRTTEHIPTSYKLGSRPVAKDWRDTDDCGGGLHLGPTPCHAREYLSRAEHYMAVEVPVAEIRPITSGGTAKCKVRTCHVVAEVDIDGATITRLKRQALDTSGRD